MQNLYSIFSSLKSVKISNHLFEKMNHEIYFEPKKKKKIQLNFESKSSPLLDREEGGEGATPFEFHRRKEQK